LQLGYHTPLPALVAGRTPAELEPVNAASTPLLPERTGLHAAFPIYGAVAMWGQVEVHETGMRGEYARVLALVLPHGEAQRVLAEAVATRYAVSLVKDTELIDEVSDAGSLWQLGT
jgi:hypothetical protein